MFPCCKWSYTPALFHSSSPLLTWVQPLLSASPSMSADIFARHDVLFAFFSPSRVCTACAVAWCTDMQGRAGKTKGDFLKGCLLELGMRIQIPLHLLFSSFLTTLWSCAHITFWEVLCHFLPIKMACFLSANKWEEEPCNNLQCIRQLLLCNDIKWWLYQLWTLAKLMHWVNSGTVLRVRNKIIQGNIHIPNPNHLTHSCSFIMIIQALCIHATISTENEKSQGWLVWIRQGVFLLPCQCIIVRLWVLSVAFAHFLAQLRMGKRGERTC